MIVRNKDGFIYEDRLLKSNSNKRPASILEMSWVAYILCALLCAVDVTFFYSLFSLISYDSPILLFFQILGLAFGFDVIPLYLGSAYKSSKEGLFQYKGILLFGLLVFLLSAGLNALLRIQSLSIYNDAQTTSYLAIKQSEGPSTEDTMMAIFGIIIPLITSVGSFVIAYLTSHPLQKRIQSLGMEISKEREVIRHLKALGKEYDLINFENIADEDRDEYTSTVGILYADALYYTRYLRLRMAQHLADPSATSALSLDIHENVLKEAEAIIQSFSELARLELDGPSGGEGSSTGSTPIEIKTKIHLLKEEESA